LIIIAGITEKVKPNTTAPAATVQTLSSTMAMRSVLVTVLNFQESNVIGVKVNSSRSYVCRTVDKAKTYMRETDPRYQSGF